MFEIGLDCDSDKLFEGRLEVKWYLGNRLVHDYLSPELAVTAGGKRLRVSLPPLVVHSGKTPVSAYARFLSSRGILELGEVNPNVPVDWKRAFVVVYVEPNEMADSRKGLALMNALGLEQFGPRAEQQFNLLSFPSRLPPDDLPLSSAGYASLDLLVMEGEGFQQTSGAQLSAIGDWVAGGGSVVVVPQGTMKARHVAFLNRLTGWQKAGAPYALDDRSQLVFSGGALAAGGKMALFRAGTGRAVIIHDLLDPEVDFETDEWKATVAFLWKVRVVQLARILQWGEWDFTPPPMSSSYLTPRPFAPQPGGHAESIRRLLMPERIEGVPLSVVVVILSLFLLAVAPGDYFLLGRLNCRRYTWLLFALVSASFTFCTVKVAERYMGDVDYRTTVTIVDLETVRGHSGPLAKPVRSSTFELLFVATQQTIETALRNCLYADLTERGGTQEDLQFRRLGITQFDEQELDQAEVAIADLPVYEGALPASFKVHQQLRQWSPRTTRRTMFADDPGAMPRTQIDWSAVASARVSSAEERQALFESLLAREPEAQVLLLNQKQAHMPTVNKAVPGNAPAGAVPGAVSWTPPPGPDTATGSAQSIPDVSSGAPILQLAAQLSVRPSSGLFAIVSQISPTGNENLEDLALLDQTNPREWLLIVAVRRGSDWVVFRRLFEEGP
jgi:hypothetical protein